MMTRSADTSKAKGDFRVLIVYPNLPLMLIPSIAIALFTRIFKEQGYQVDMFDTTHYLWNENISSEARVENLNVREFDLKEGLEIIVKKDLFDDFRAKVEAFKPDFMIYSVVEDVFRLTVDLLRGIEDLHIPHLLGGVFPTNAPDRCFTHPEVNMIGLGEGERSVVAVAEAIRLGQPLHDILGTWFRDEHGQIHKNPKDPLVDINQYLPDFSLFAENRFYRPMGGRIFKMIPIETYRGCPYSCTYCNSPAQRSFSKENNLGNFLRRKTMDTVRRELEEYILLYSPTFIYIVDDSFLARPHKEIFEFCDMYEDIGLPFWFNTRTEGCNVENLARLKEVGCYRISFGIECGNEIYRQKVLRRKVKNTELIDQFKIIAASGIKFSVNLIIGMPGETRDLVMDTIELVRSIDGYDALTVSIFTPYHGTVLRNVALKNKWLDPNRMTTHFLDRSLLEMPKPYLNADEIDGLIRTVPLYTYFPKSEWENIQRAEILDQEGDRIFEHYSEIYRKIFLGETQDTEKELILKGAGGCRSNPKDSFRFSPKRMSEDELHLLI